MTSFNFTQVLRGMFLASSRPEATRRSAHQPPLLERNLQLIVEFPEAVSEKRCKAARAMLTGDFRAHEPNLNRISTANELLHHREVSSKVFVFESFTIRKAAAFSVFGDIDYDKYVYVQADKTTLRSYCTLPKNAPFELIARIEGNQIVHLLYSTERGRGFDKLGAVQHARSLARDI